VLGTYQLQVFVAVVEEGSFTAAARRLHLTQPAVSRQVRLLQEHLGVRLFQRVGRRMVPTHAAERLVEMARQVLAFSRHIEEEMSFLRGEIIGVLRVGGSGAPAWHALSGLLPTFRAAYPGVGFRLDMLPAEGAGRALREGRLDLLITEEEISGHALACDLLVEMETVLVVPLDEPWIRRKRFSLGKLAEAPLILPASRTPAGRFLEEYLGGRGIRLPSPVHALDVVDPGAALPLVGAGLGVTLLPRPLTRIVSTPVHTVKLWPRFSWPLFLVRRATPASQVEETFCTFALEEGRRLLRRGGKHSTESEPLGR
jgi:DNA-binding transcriptional LysR family regulator